ncbi:MAG TPA: polysaccharide biosynthesis/export family protein, partial [Pyrinomonadaceae bacterium]|nr:polysaccharide biosynthesis/export family protein [Pyrinomonadaceae bacterium]
MMKYLLSIVTLFCIAFAIAAEARGKAPLKSPVPIPTATPPANADSNDSEDSLLPFYDNFLAEYVLGPEDVISVDVFGHANYSKSGIVVPPTARISYPLIRGGIFVGGKTTEQVAEIIQKELNEYIIDPQVTVTLDKVGSARFSVLGRVATPGIRPMNRKYSLYEAIAEAGGIVEKGDRNRVVLV